MIRHFNQDFKTRLWKIVSAIENDSLVEIVVMIKPRSADYRDSVLWWGIGAAFAIFTFLMFAPIIFGDYLLYSGPVVGFFGGIIAASFFPPLQRLMIRAKRRQRQVEIMARALFQKGGIRHTNEKIGILIYCSLFEKMSYVVADRGVETPWWRVDFVAWKASPAVGRSPSESSIAPAANRPAGGAPNGPGVRYHERHESTEGTG